MSIIVEPRYLASFTGLESLHQKDFISIYRNDGEILASKRGKGGAVSELMPGALPKFDQPTGTMVLSGTWFPDNKPSVIAWYAVGGYPLLSIVGLSKRAFLAPFDAMARITFVLQ
ncbi:hypothetical protein [Noviherbaspirillum saxi]|uniref:hypothetical protein n=1 Tax=Noviherbaspirillum saxi TaxID=2320863 RepID=UPI0011C3A541|nr:hypothetical protein [Noviherbaspirillum saxi]